MPVMKCHKCAPPYEHLVLISLKQEIYDKFVQFREFGEIQLETFAQIILTEKTTEPEYKNVHVSAPGKYIYTFVKSHEVGSRIV